MRTTRHVRALVLALTVLAAKACTYSPQIDSGKLACSAKGECPRGFTCAASGRCVSNDGTGLTGGGLPDGGTVGTPADANTDFRFDASGIDLKVGSGGNSGAGGASGIPASYLGTWLFKPATVATDCGSAGTSTNSLAGTTLTIHETGAGANILGASWSEWPDCTYELILDDLGLHIHDTSWACEITSTTVTTDWYIGSFDVVTSDGRTAIHDGTYSRVDSNADGSTIYCDQVVHAQLTKQ